MLTTTLILMAIAAIASLMIAMTDTDAERAVDLRKAEMVRRAAIRRAIVRTEYPRLVASIEAERDAASAKGLVDIAAYHEHRIVTLSHRIAIVEGR